MSEYTKTTTVNDLMIKTRKPNHLASRLEKQAAAGAALPKHLLHQYRYLQQYTQLVRQSLSSIFTEEILAECQVVCVSPTKLTLSLGSPTAANHARYLIENCVQALRAYDQRFCQLQSIKIIFVPNPKTLKKPQSDTHLDGIKKTLSENTKEMIAQSSQFVTQNPSLQHALQCLANDFIGNSK